MGERFRNEVKANSEYLHRTPQQPTATYIAALGLLPEL